MDAVTSPKVSQVEGRWRLCLALIGDTASGQAWQVAVLCIHYMVAGSSAGR